MFHESDERKPEEDRGRQTLTVCPLGSKVLWGHQSGESEGCDGITSFRCTFIPDEDDFDERLVWGLTWTGMGV